MKRIPIDQPDAASLAAAAMREGGVIVMPTDTLYGFSAAIGDRHAYERIIAAKGSDEGRPFICLADSIATVARYVRGWGSTSRDALAAIWPAPLTAVLPAGGRCPEWFGDTVAFRVPDYAFAREAVAALGEPVVSTSVNRAGATPLDDDAAIVAAFDAHADLIVVRKQVTGGVASTVVDMTVSPPRVVRAGGYAWPTSGKPSN